MKLWEVLKASEEGKIIQARWEGYGKWMEIDKEALACWTNSAAEKVEWRIKSEPKTFYRNLYKEGWAGSHDTAQRAIDAAKHSAIRVAVKFVEVEE